jgi:hypothetical protein
MYGPDRVELACARALACGAISQKNIRIMLKNNLEAAALPEAAPATPPIQHANIRGAAYYAAPQLSLDMER